MSAHSWVELAIYIAVVVGVAFPLGIWIARVLNGSLSSSRPMLTRLESRILRGLGQGEPSSMSWDTYARALIAFTFVGLIALYGLQRLQGWLPFNPRGVGGVAPDLAFNTAVSFVTNTNWQAYSGESTLSYLTQMIGLGVQNFLSAGVGLAVFAALCRGLSSKGDPGLGNFWVDLVRSTLYIFLPLSMLLAVALVSQGVVQSFASYAEIETIEGTLQVLPLGPAASQIAIKQLGTNGGGYFGTNSCHPFENPTAVSNFLECTSILLIPTALCFAFGRMVGDRRQGVALLLAMAALAAAPLFVCLLSEQTGNPRLQVLGADQSASDVQSGGNMEGKEARFGVVSSSIWAIATTAASNGSVNAMHDSLMPASGLSAIWMMLLGEVSFGGVGSGLYGMILYVIITVFVAGMMVGRTPEYLGKKIEPFEMKMAVLAVLAPSACVLIGAGTAACAEPLLNSTSSPGAHGLTQILYAFASAANNNGSAFAGLAANQPFYNVALSICMLVGRFLVILPTLAVAGSLARKHAAPSSVGVLPTHTFTFGCLLVSTVVIVGALTFAPALALGPVAEHLQLFSER